MGGWSQVPGPRLTELISETQNHLARTVNLQTCFPGFSCITQESRFSLPASPSPFFLAMRQPFCTSKVLPLYFDKWATAHCPFTSETPPIVHCLHLSARETWVYNKLHVRLGKARDLDSEGLFQIYALPLMSCVILGESLHLSETSASSPLSGCNSPLLTVVRKGS